MTVGTTRTIATAVLTVFWTTLVLTVFFAAIPDSPMRPSLKAKARLLTVLPEGWGFFTRSPREESIFAHGRAGGGWKELNFTATSARNWGGFLRRSRVQGVELSALTEGLKDEAWVAHQDPFAPDADLSTLTRLEVENPAVVQTMCGEILLERRPPIPWAWSRSERTIRMPAQYVLLSVDCSAPADAEVAGVAPSPAREES